MVVVEGVLVAFGKLEVFAGGVVVFGGVLVVVL